MQGNIIWINKITDTLYMALSPGGIAVTCYGREKVLKGISSRTGAILWESRIARIPVAIACLPSHRGEESDVVALGASANSHAISFFEANTGRPCFELHYDTCVQESVCSVGDYGEFVTAGRTRHIEIPSDSGNADVRKWVGGAEIICLWPSRNTRDIVDLPSTLNDICCLSSYGAGQKLLIGGLSGWKGGIEIIDRTSMRLEKCIAGEFKCVRRMAVLECEQLLTLIDVDWDALRVYDLKAERWLSPIGYSGLQVIDVTPTSTRDTVVVALSGGRCAITDVRKRESRSYAICDGEMDRIQYSASNRAVIWYGSEQMGAFEIEV